MRRSDADSTAAPPLRYRLHLTNVAGLGASRLVESALSVIESRQGYALDEVYLPVRGPLAGFHPHGSDIRIVRYRRRLPNSISRLYECTVGSARFEGVTPLLVLGDIPLRVACRQSVFVQQRFLLDDDDSSSPLFTLKIAALRRVFAANLRFASSLIVQSELMKSALHCRYPGLRATVHVIPQPAPAAVIESGLRRVGRVGASRGHVSLFYPAAPLPHKNHNLLSAIGLPEIALWGVERLTLTIPQRNNPNPAVPWIDCVGEIRGEDVIKAYAGCDALLFLSSTESYGVPLVEAMAVGLPIVCPDLPYARNLCGDTAIYFAAGDIRSLQSAVAELNSKLDAGWWPDWSRELSRIPGDWGTVADAMLSTLFD